MTTHSTTMACAWALITMTTTALASAQGYAPPPGAPAPGSAPPPAGAPATATGVGYDTAPTAPPQTAHPPERTWGLGLKAGPLMPGTVSVEDVDVDTEMGYVLSANADYIVTPKFSMGAYILRASTSAEDFDADASVLGMGALLKVRIGDPNGVQFRPGFAVGYQLSDVDDSAAEDVKGLGLAAVGELAFPLSDSLFGVAEVSFISQPTGGNDDVEVAWAPILYFAAGLEFGG